MAAEDFGAGQRLPVPDLDRVVPKSRNDFCVVVLKAVNALGILGPGKPNAAVVVREVKRRHLNDVDFFFFWGGGGIIGL